LLVVNVFLLLPLPSNISHHNQPKRTHQIFNKSTLGLFCTWMNYHHFLLAAYITYFLFLDFDSFVWERCAPTALLFCGMFSLGS